MVKFTKVYTATMKEGKKCESEQWKVIGCRPANRKTFTFSNTEVQNYFRFMLNYGKQKEKSGDFLWRSSDQHLKSLQRKQLLLYNLQLYL